MSQEQTVAETQVINEWDSVIIQINNGEIGGGSIRMMKQDIDAIMELHGVDRGYALEMMLQAVETTPKENFEQKQ
jgi:aspartyl-tRNA synthetase